MLGPFGTPALGNGGLLAQLQAQGGPGLAALLAAIQSASNGSQQPPIAPGGTGIFQAPLPIPPASNAGFMPFILPTPSPAPPPVINPLGNPREGQFPQQPRAPQNQGERSGMMFNGGQGDSGQNGIGANGQAAGQMGTAGPQGTFGKEASDALAGGLASLMGGFGVGTIGSLAAHGYLGDAFGPANLHNADINPAAYGLDASGYSAADFGGNAGGYGGGAEAAGGGYGSDAGGHAGQGSAEGGFVKGGVVKGPAPKNPKKDNMRVNVQAGEEIEPRQAVRMFGPQLEAMRRVALTRGTPQRKRLVKGKLTVR